MDLTIDGFAGAIKFGKSYLSKIERGVAPAPSERFVDQVCYVFGVNRDWLTSGVGTAFLPKGEWHSGGSAKLGKNDEEFAEILWIAGKMLSLCRVPSDIVYQMEVALDAARPGQGQLGEIYRCAMKILAAELRAQMLAKEGESAVANPFTPITQQAKMALNYPLPTKGAFIKE